MGARTPPRRQLWRSSPPGRRRLISHPKAHRIRACALGATDWFRLPITSATTALPRRLQFGREKHQMPNVSARLVGDRSGSPSVDAWRRGDRGRGGGEGHMQRNRGHELGQRAQPAMGQPRRARRARVEMEHDERSRKADTEGTRDEVFTATLASGRRPARFTGPSHRPGSSASRWGADKSHGVGKSRAAGPSMKPWSYSSDCERADRPTGVWQAGRTHADGARYPTSSGGPASADSCAPRRISHASSSRHDLTPTRTRQRGEREAGRGHRLDPA